MYKKNRKLFNVGTMVLISTLFVLISINVFADVLKTPSIWYMVYK